MLDPHPADAGPLHGLADFPDEVIEPFTRLAVRALAAPVAILFLKKGTGSLPDDRLVVRCGTGLPDSLSPRREIPYFLKPG
jgi:hypothetical protein